MQSKTLQESLGGASRLSRERLLDLISGEVWLAVCPSVSACRRCSFTYAAHDRPKSVHSDRYRR